MDSKRVARYTSDWFSRLLLVGLLGVAACNDFQPNTEQQTYLRQAFDSIAHYSYFHDQFDFDSLEAVYLDQITDTTSTAALHRWIDEAVKTIDHHSYTLEKELFNAMWSGDLNDLTGQPYPFQGKLLDDHVAFVTLDGFVGVDSVSSHNYADSLQRLLLKLNRFEPAGWIVDLRHNDGGWVYPMITGLGPLLGLGDLVYEVDASGEIDTFRYARSLEDSIALVDSVIVFDPLPPVTVLIGSGTGSAGEMLVLAFRGREQATSVGRPTYGVATGLHGFFMPDSFHVAVTNNVMLDRNKEGDGGPIIPEIPARDNVESFQKARHWLQEKSEVQTD